MCKKLSLLVSFVLLLASVGNAADVKWTGSAGDRLWSNPDNWDPVRVPTLADEVLIDVPAAAAPNGPVIQAGIDAKAKGILTEAAGEPTLTITGGTLEVAGYIWFGDGNGSFGIWTMSGGTVDVADEFELGWDGGAGTLTLTGGTISAGEAVIPTGSGAFGELFLQGGTYNVTKADGLQVKANGLIDITEGALVLEGDDTAKVNGLIAAGHITAYGGAGQIEMDFGVRNPGKTTLTAIERVTFLFDDFESYAADVIMGAFGWIILDTPEAIEGSTWTITNPGGRGNPGTLDGSASTGQFLISDSDQQSESNPVDSGASHDISTPSFSTLGVTTVWLHADVSAQLNNNGAAIFDVEVSTDRGGTWTNVFSRVAPGRASAEGATTRLPDNTNTDGYFGRLDVDLSAVAANQADVKVRFRHFEPNWDWWIAIDNVLIDNVAAPQGGPATVFSEDFSNGLGQMNVVSGQGNTGTETWHTSDKGGRYVPGAVGEQGVNRLGPHPNEHAEFAIIDSDADPDPNEDEWLMTPSLDLSDMAEVFLHYESETVMSSGVVNQEVLVSIDGGTTFEAAPIFAYTGGGLFDNGEEPVYAARVFDVSGTAAAESQVVFAFRYTGGGDNWWWAIDNVKVSGSLLPEPVDPGTEGLAAFYALDGDANDSSGNGIDGTIHNADIGGLGDGGSVWVDDPERGTVISFNGTAEGAHVRAGDIPQMTLANDFTWAFWAKHSDENTADNDIILGNRMAENVVDFVPRQFIKFTPTKFEWHMNGNGDDNLDYDDIPADVWLHHSVVKAGDRLTYYRNGIEASSGTFTQPLDFPQPLFFGGDNEGSEGENWAGLMSDVCIYDRALSGGEVRYLAGHRAPAEAPGPVGHWTLDEGSGTTVADVSGNGNDGTIMDNPDLENPTWIDGISGSALEFHGTGVAGTGGDFIDCGNDASLDITGPISIALWIRPDADDPEGKGTSGGETAPMAKATSDWSWQVRYGWGGAPTPYMSFTFNTSPRAWASVGRNLERYEWCHIACSYDGTTLKCYLDGVETDSTPMGEIHSSADPVLIGSDGWKCDWTGAIDDVRIYDRGLSADEIVDIAAGL